MEEKFRFFFKLIKENVEIEIVESDTGYTHEKNVINVIKYRKQDKSGDYLIIIKNLIDSPESKISKDFSIVVFLIDKLWDLYSGGKTPIFKMGMLQLIEWSNEFLMGIINNKIDFSGEDCQYEGIVPYLNSISNSQYEGDSLKAKLLLINENNIRSYINLIIDFKEKIPYKEVKKVRKIMEMCSDRIFVVGDNEGIYGLGHFKEYGEAYSQKLDREIIFIEFNEKSHYSVKEVNFIKQEFSYFEKQRENMSFSFKEYLIYKVKDNRIFFNEREFPQGNITYALNRIFFNESEKNNIRTTKKILEIIKATSLQTHGTMIVIGTSELADSETNRLAAYQQAMKVEKIDLFKMDVKKRDLLLNQISSIDGAIYLDIMGNVHGIGVILDGPAHPSGDSSRGARYNSAVKYNSSDEDITNNSLIIVVSEDGYIDVIAKNTKEYNLLLDSIQEKLFNANYKEAVEEMNRHEKDLRGIGRFDFLKALSNYRLGNYEESIFLLLDILKNRGKKEVLKDDFVSHNLENIYSLISYNYWELDEYEDALYYINKAIEVDNHYKFYKSNKLEILNKLGWETEYKAYAKELYDENPTEFQYLKKDIDSSDD